MRRANDSAISADGSTPVTAEIGEELRRCSPRRSRPRCMHLRRSPMPRVRRGSAVRILVYVRNRTALRNDNNALSIRRGLLFQIFFHSHYRLSRGSTVAAVARSAHREGGPEHGVLFRQAGNPRSAALCRPLAHRPNRLSSRRIELGDRARPAFGRPIGGASCRRPVAHTAEYGG